MKRALICAVSLHNILQGHTVVLLSVSDVLGPYLLAGKLLSPARQLQWLLPGGEQGCSGKKAHMDLLFRACPCVWWHAGAWCSTLQPGVTVFVRLLWAPPSTFTPWVLTKFLSPCLRSCPVAETTRHESAAVMNNLTLMPFNEEMVPERITAYCFAFEYSFKLLNISLRRHTLCRW